MAVTARKVTRLSKEESILTHILLNFLMCTFFLWLSHNRNCTVQSVLFIKSQAHTLIENCTLCYSPHRVIMLSSAEDHTAGGDLLLGGACGRKMLTATQRRCEAVRRDWGHCVGDWYTALLQLERHHTIVKATSHTHPSYCSHTKKCMYFQTNLFV